MGRNPEVATLIGWTAFPRERRFFGDPHGAVRGGPMSNGNVFRVGPPTKLLFYLLFLSIWRVNKTDDPVLTPAFIVELGTNWIQLPPPRCHPDPILCNALAYQSLFDPIRSSL